MHGPQGKARHDQRRRGSALRRPLRRPSSWVAGTLLGVAALACQAEGEVLDLANLSLEELANIRITSVSKKDQSLTDAAASVFVITHDDIRRSGATSLPEALRLAPNLHVAQVSNTGYAISARAFNGPPRSAPNKLLVLIDGRSVYTPLFSGVFWDVQNVMLEDVERIEVISGPGSTLWGTNAVNGVINVITRAAGSTPGGLAAVGGGNQESRGALRYGGPAGEDGSYRVYGLYGERRHTETARGSPVDDASHMAQAGFRFDWRRAGDQLMLQGNTYDGGSGQPAPGAIATGAAFVLGDIRTSGFNLLSHWERALEREGSLSLQLYYDSTRRTVPPTFGESLDILDLQLQHALPKSAMHAAVWGAGYRYGRDRLTNSAFFAFLPAHLDQQWGNVFVQDEMTLREDLRLTLGARLERNDYTGVEFLPNARLAWKAAPDQLLWGAASRTVRAPSRLDRDPFVPVVPGSPVFLLRGGPEVRSEVAKVYELGYRGQPLASLSFSATVFHADYEHLRTQELVGTPPAYLVFASNMEGHSNGIEMWGSWQATSAWRWSAGYTAQASHLKLRPGSTDLDALLGAGQDPDSQWTLRSALNLSPRSELDLSLRHVAGLSNPEVPAYTVVDLRYGWRPRRDLEVSLTARNLGNKHGEFSSLLTRSELAPAAFLKLVSRF